MIEKKPNQREMNYLNGKIAQFMDAYIRQNKVWIPDQMLEAFREKIQDGLDRGHFTRNYQDGTEVWNSKNADLWLISQNGQTLAFERMQKKYEKDKPVAIANSPIVERVRFGYGWKKELFFDISYGLKHGHSFVETEKLKKYPHNPWSISHVKQQLHDLYGTTLPEVLALLSKSPIEEAFFKHWLENYYDDCNNPALIPEVCGFRAKFYYYEHNGHVYASSNEVPEDINPLEVKPKNFRFDFFVSNVRKKKAVLIELDGHDNHKTKSQRIVDSIKRNTAASLGVPVVVFTGTQIHADIGACFKHIDELLE